VVLDFAEFESSEVTGDDELQNLILTMNFKGLRVSIEAPGSPRRRQSD
jgi:hypothetical protein